MKKLLILILSIFTISLITFNTSVSKSGVANMPNSPRP